MNLRIEITVVHCDLSKLVEGLEGRVFSNIGRLFQLGGVFRFRIYGITSQYLVIYLDVLVGIVLSDYGLVENGIR